MGLCLNTSASLSEDLHADGRPKVIGNKTEGALLLLLQVSEKPKATQPRAWL